MDMREEPEVRRTWTGNAITCGGNMRRSLW